MRYKKSVLMTEEKFLIMKVFLRVSIGFAMEVSIYNRKNKLINGFFLVK